MKAALRTPTTGTAPMKRNAAGAAPASAVTPSWTRVVHEQLRAAGTALRAELIAAGLLMTLVSVLTLVAFAMHRARANYALIDFGLAAVIMGLFVPMGLWKGEGPARRSYFWSLPVNRFYHTLVRVFSGWVWLMAFVGLYICWVLAMNTLTGGDTEIGAGWAFAMMRDHLPAPEPMPTALHEHARFWFVPPVAATVMYLIGSTIVLASNHPWRWFAGAVFTAILLLLLSEAGGIVVLAHGMSALLAGQYGLVPLLTGMPSRQMWVGTSLLWLALAMLAMLAAAYRYQER